jgi:crotonobetainyl-CoA:carnitine CoA-transferase CaiB-like acyl-CoA transferase
MSMNGFPDGAPVRTGVPIIDMSSGMMACNAILAALLAREKLGKGQHVEVALFDQAITMTGFYGPNFLVSGEEQKRFGNSPGGSATVGLFEAHDGPFYVAASNDRLFRRLVTEVLHKPELAQDPEFATPKARAANKVKLRQVIEGLFKAGNKGRDQWVTELKAANVPAGPLRTVPEAFVSPELEDRALVSGLPHPVAGTVPNIAPPLRLSETPIADPVAAPLLGQHTEEVCRLLGYDATRIAALRAAGAFGKS